MILIVVSTLSCTQNNSFKFKAVDNKTTSWSNDSIKNVTISVRLKQAYDSIYLHQDSISRRTYDISIAIFNLSNTTVAFWMMTCSWHDNFLINNDYICFCSWGCDKNFPTLIKLKPNYSLVLKASVCKWPNDPRPNNSTTRFGLNYIDSIKCKNYNEYNETMSDLSKWDRIIWSNPLYLQDN